MNRLTEKRNNGRWAQRSPMMGGRHRMKVLVACEESQTVCKAFRDLGHEAYSCDIKKPSGGHPEWHILNDALKTLEGGQW